MSGFAEIDVSEPPARPRSLPQLEAAIRRDLEILAYPSKGWMPKPRPADAPAYDVAVIGGGHCGLSAGFALMRERIDNIIVLDENDAGQEGPWLSYARMPDLRTRKAVTGVELGYSNLTFRAYYEAREGEEAYGAMPRISCDDWTSYLLWLRRVLNVPVANGSRVERIIPEGDRFRLEGARRGEPFSVYARRLVLATGPLSTGGAGIPDAVRIGLPKSAYRHVYDRGPWPELKGRRVVVVGAGASAFDNAGAALEQGAGRVDLLVRRPHVPRLSLIRWTDWAGFLNTYADLDDARKWRLTREIQRNPAPPPIRAIRRVEKWPNFHIHFNAPIERAEPIGAGVRITTPTESIEADIVLLATGFTFDLKACSPIAEFADEIALWSDRYEPADGPGPEKFRNSPYLGKRYEFIEKRRGAAPYLKHIFNFNQSATLSMGPTGRISGLKYGLRRLMLGISESFLREDFDAHLATVQAYDDSELDGHPWVEPRRPSASP